MPRDKGKDVTDLEGPDLLFVYGSLQRGERMFTELGLERALEFVCDGTIRGNLYDLGDYPGAVAADGVVQGEVYRIKDPAILAALDEYEEFDPCNRQDSLFVRELIFVPEAGPAWTYIYNGNREEGRLISSGHWRKPRSAA